MPTLDVAATSSPAEQTSKIAKTTALNCAVPENEGIYVAFMELCELYGKEGNYNASATYRKVSGAISLLNIVITKDNAKGLCKGKTKVPGIGKASADKMYELVTTGSIAKLEEKRSALSNNP